MNQLTTLNEYAEVVMELSTAIDLIKLSKQKLSYTGNIECALKDCIKVRQECLDELWNANVIAIDAHIRE